jgi:Ca2+-transporting ATPase
VFPALALSQSKGDPDVMDKPPKNPREAIVTRANWREIAVFGSIIALFVTGGYIFADKFLGLSKDISNNVAFFSLALSQFWHVFNMREDHENIWKNQVTRNKYIWGALAISITGLLAAYFIPGLNDVLSFQEMGTNIWLLIFGISLCPLITIQLYKWARHKQKNRG